MSISPHGPGFSFVDTYQVAEDNRSLSASKFLDPAMPFFADHFPGNPLMPGVLMIESAAQACGILWSSIQAEEKGEFTMLAQVQQFKIKKPVLPGSTLEMLVTLQRDFGALAQFAAGLSVAGESVAEGILILGRKGPTAESS